LETVPVKYLVGIPFVNREDLLKRALNSIPPKCWHDEAILILDNSANPHRSQIRYVPAVPLTFAQSMNFFRRQALERECDVLIFMHNDACCEPSVFERLLERATNRAIHWGVIFTNYDALAAFNMAAMKQVGEWDTNLPQYFSDNDYYRRMRLAGWLTEDSGFPVEHTASQTINSDPERAFLNGVTFPLYREYYRKKWGGDGGQETFAMPFNRCPS
jgi:hypothetical protein